MKIKGIIFHCSDSDARSHDNIETIYNWHIQRGFSDIGYHYFIRSNGSIEIGRLNTEKGAHCRGNNDNIGVCLHGSLNFTDEQFETAAKLAVNLMNAYSLTTSQIHGHNEFNKNKTCPNFNMDEIIGRIRGKIRK